jgi:processive 1,2-diacylglycerol beta-glucosyltransferase
VALAVGALADGGVARNRVYNLASNENVSIKQIAERVRELVGDVEIVYTPARPGDFDGKVVCSRRARDELSWTAATPFAEGVRRYLDWRREQEALTATRAADSVIPAGEPDAEAERRKVLIISADIGEGHDLPARAVAREFADEEPDAQISIVNGLPAMGPVLTRVLRENSEFMFRWVPWWFHFQYLLFMYFRPTRWLARTLLTAFGRRGLMRLIRSHDPDLIVSTYPGVTAVLGELRRRAKLDVPCYSSITDLAGLQFWAHPGIDMHFVTHPESIEEVERIAGRGSVAWAKPPTSPAFLAARSRSDARRALALPLDARVIAVSGGGWAVGDLAGATRAALEAAPDATVLCLCGRNDKLRARIAKQFDGESRLRIMGFTDRMGDVLAASDALIHSSGGLTVLEAIIRGCPLISYGFDYGHVHAANVALERFGLAQVARDVEELPAALERALTSRPEPDGSFARRPSTASLILGDERRVSPLPRWRLRSARAAAATTAMLLIGGWTLTAGASYKLVSHFVHMRPTTAVSTTRPEVGLLVKAPPAELPLLASELAARGIHASFALDRGLPGAAGGLGGYGDQAIPMLPGGGLVRWLNTRDELHDLLHTNGLGHHFLYASAGPSVGQWYLAHRAGGRLVAGAIRLDDRDDTVGPLHAGEVVELTLSQSGDVALLAQRLEDALIANHLSAVPVGRLMQDAGVRA